MSGASSSNTSRKRWANLMPLLVVLVLVADIAFLTQLDLPKNAALLADKFCQFTSSSSSSSAAAGLDRSSDGDNCEEWLERQDFVEHSRDFQKEPILVKGGDQECKSCAVGCKFGYNPNKKPDAGFGLSHQPGTASVLRSMESSQYYAANNIALARRWLRGYNIVMTTSLSSDVPVGYFSWSEYDITAPLQPKTEKALAAAFISNCGARNFRLQALEALEEADIKIDSYGSCHRNRDEAVEKVKTLKHYKFSLAFENSDEEDYVTEKYFQPLVAGSVPVVVGAPNIQDFAPSPSSFLHIRELEDANAVAKTMKYLAKNPDAYNQSVRWKSSNLTLETLESAVLLKFKSLKHHVPIWKLQRPESIRGRDELKIYSVYPVGKTQGRFVYLQIRRGC
ncbi:unnamed protein product [Camellia sinensis]